jgi:hypothetical protein
MMVDIRGWKNFIPIPYFDPEAAGVLVSGLLIPGLIPGCGE